MVAAVLQALRCIASSEEDAEVWDAASAGAMVGATASAGADVGGSNACGHVGQPYVGCR